MLHPNGDVSASYPPRLLAAIQTDFPIEPRPFQVIGERLGMAENEVIDTIRRLEDEGVIRVFGPVFENRKLGYISTLIAASVDEDRVAEIAAAMLDMREITHNYLRDHEFNLWFTVIARDRDILDGILKWVEKFPGVDQLLNLRTRRVFKVRAVWGTESPDSPIGETDATPPVVDERTIRLVRALQNPFPIVTNPFALIASTIGEDEAALMGVVRGWIADGTIRRFGARLNHRKLGLASNTLVAWEGKNVEAWGLKFAEMPEVSHCYLREPYQSWPYELYTMVHAPSQVKTNKIINHMSEIARGSRMIRLKTLYELKKTPMKYFMEE